MARRFNHSGGKRAESQIPSREYVEYMIDFLLGYLDGLDEAAPEFDADNYMLAEKAELMEMV